MQSPTHSYQAHLDWISAARQESARVRRVGGSSAFGPPRKDEPTGLQRDLIPGYALRRELHRGGQGVVYEATQASTGRVVAVKVLREGPFAGERDRQRFEREVGILARLNHRSIVRIIDRGTVTGIEFLVMDFIDGRPLDRYVRDHALHVCETLQLFALVCDAVNAAHQRGVIHRDLKPGNILVDSAGEPRVLDFGLAKMSENPDRSDGEFATATGQFLGSLPWTSPEQATGSLENIDVRSDVYSLGVVLYQLITGRFPYSIVGDVGTIMANIQRAEPVQPRSLSRTIDDDLQTIILKCLSKDPSRRYQSVGELARDVRHYLAAEPIEAKRDSSWYVLKKTLRRHWAAAGIATAFVCLAAVGLLASLLLLQRVRTQRDRAIRAETAERAERGRAEADAARAKAVNKLMHDALAAANPEVMPVRDLTVRQMLDSEALAIDGGALRSEPAVEAAARLTIGQSYLALGQLDAAAGQFEAAARLNKGLFGAWSEPYADSLHWLGVLAWRREKPQEAERLLRQSVEMQRGLRAGDSEALARSLAALGLALESQGRRDECVALTREAAEMLRRVLGPDHVDVVALESVLAARSHDARESVPLANRSVEALRKTFGDKHPQVALALKRKGSALMGQHDFAGAAAAFEAALRMFREVLGDDNPDTLNCVDDLSYVYLHTGRRQDALSIMREFLPAADRAYGSNSHFRTDYLIESARALVAAGDPGGGERVFREVLDALARANEADTIRANSARLALAELLLSRDACDEAETFVRASQNYFDRHRESTTHAAHARLEILNGNLLVCRHEYAQAEAVLLNAMHMFDTSSPTQAGNASAAMHALVRLYERWDADAPGTGKSQLASEWRTRIVNTNPASQPARAPVGP